MRQDDKYVYFAAFEYTNGDDEDHTNFLSSHRAKPIISPDDFNAFVEEIRKELRAKKVKITAMSLIHDPRNK